jgi:HIP---CoA ligase
VAFEDLRSPVNGVLDSSCRFSQRSAVESAEVRWTYSEIGEQIVGAFIAWGIEPGDRVGLCAETIVSLSPTRSADTPGVEVTFADDGDWEVPTGQAGNILVGGYTVMTGYWRDPEATAAAKMLASRLRTGAVGSLDEHGFLRIVARKKDVILVGGFNVYPAEVERFLSLHPLVAEAAVVGVPDERLGEVPFAFVVPVPGAHVDAAEFLEWARGQMANCKAPRSVEFVESLPKNSSMKVLRDDLRMRGLANVGRRRVG